MNFLIAWFACVFVMTLLMGPFFGIILGTICAPAMYCHMKDDEEQKRKQQERERKFDEWLDNQLDNE